MVSRQSIWHCIRAEAQGTTFASFAAAGGMPHPGEDAGQVHVLELRRPLAGELRVQMLPGPAERLASLGRFGPQPLGDARRRCWRNRRS